MILQRHQRLLVSLASPVSAQQLHITTFYDGGERHTTTSDDTAYVEIIPIGEQHSIGNIFIHNADEADHSVKVSMEDAGKRSPIIAHTLLAGETLTYSGGARLWQRLSPHPGRFLRSLLPH